MSVHRKVCIMECIYAYEERNDDDDDDYDDDVIIETKKRTRSWSGEYILFSGKINIVICNFKR